MKRIVLIGIAVAGLFSAGISTVATAATTKSVPHTTTVTGRATCKLYLVTVAPPGQPTNLPGSPSGVQWGSTHCSGAAAEASRATFTVADSGNLSGNIEHFFRGGTLSGTYSLTAGAASGPPTAGSFGAASYSGTVKLTTGQGAYKGTTATGTLSCTTPDGAHYNCIEKLKLSAPTAP